MKKFASGPRQTLRSLLPKGLFHLVQPRPFHAFAVGAEKTGTTSIAKLFEPNYRAEHEPQWNSTVKRMFRLSLNEMPETAFVSFLTRRDKRIWLELESSCLMGHCAPHLWTAFPDAKFILTVRDCLSWLKSDINHHMTHKREDAGMDMWYQVAFQPDRFEYTSYDEPLRQRDLFPLDCFLTYWANSISRVTDCIPPDQLLVIRTKDISDSGPALSRFLNVPTESMTFSQSHHNPGKVDHKIFEQLDRGYVAERCREICGLQMQQLFPEIDI